MGRLRFVPQGKNPCLDVKTDEDARTLILEYPLICILVRCEGLESVDTVLGAA
jgi:hypothetical protein